ncbi:hypothetical protein BGX20_010107 [Mortierella sp. AD010]|nr:hypothetical protein BGX20_010107 [Mortierella sp. AD010]
MSVSYQRVRTALNSNRLTKYQKDKDVHTSVKHWIKQIQAVQGKAFFDSAPKAHVDDFLVGWCTSFQLQIIADNHDIYCMDSTHKTVKSIKKALSDEGRTTFKSAYLFTLLVKDRTVKKGIPVSFMISSSESRYLIQAWLRWLKYECGLRTSAFMVDCAKTESEAISSVFPHSRIFYCDFHVAQLWEKHLKQKTSAHKNREMRPLLKLVRTAPTAMDQQHLWESFKLRFPEAIPLINYIEKNWLEEHLERWAAQDAQADIFEPRAYVRVDYLLYLLQGAIDDFHIEYIKMKSGLEPLPISQEDKLRKRRAAAVPFEHALSMTTPLFDEKKCIVKSFKSPTVQYSVSLRPTNRLNMNEPEELLQSCTCPDYQMRQRPSFVRVDYYVHLEQVDEGHVDMQEALAKDVPDWIPLPVKQYLYAERARERGDEERRLEQQRAKAIADCEKEALVLWRQLGMSLANRQRVCSLEYYQNFVTSLRNLVCDSQGLHT